MLSKHSLEYFLRPKIFYQLPKAVFKTLCKIYWLLATIMDVQFWRRIFYNLLNVIVTV